MLHDIVRGCRFHAFVSSLVGYLVDTELQASLGPLRIVALYRPWTMPTAPERERCDREYCDAGDRGFDRVGGAPRHNRERERNRCASNDPRVQRRRCREWLRAGCIGDLTFSLCRSSSPSVQRTA